MVEYRIHESEGIYNNKINVRPSLEVLIINNIKFFLEKCSYD